MFSGLVADLGRISVIDRDDEGARLTVETALTPEIGLGDSVAVNGVCLTATEVSGTGFTAEAMRQTLDLTSLGEIEADSRVNLELALRADQRLGGHIVQGHVDGVGRVASLTGVSLPGIVPVRGSTNAAGNDWIGLRTTDDSVLKSVSRVPLFGGFFGLGLLLLALGSMWYREGR